MIGNAHINPVWQWQEGSQEVKSTFRGPQAGHQGQYPAPQIGQGDLGRFCILQDQDLPRPHSREPARDRDEPARMGSAGRMSQLLPILATPRGLLPSRSYSQKSPG